MPDNTINELISKILKNLKLSITDNIFEDLYSLGKMLRQSQQSQVNFSNKVEKFPSLTKDSEYRDSFESNIQRIIDKNDDQNITQATPEQISNLIKLFIIWKGNFFENRNKYQSYKDKNNITKEDRFNIYSAIFALCYTACHLNSKEHTDPAFKKFDNNNILWSLKTLNNDQKKLSSSIPYNEKRKQKILEKNKEIKLNKLHKQNLLEKNKIRKKELLKEIKEIEENKRTEEIIESKQEPLKKIEQIKKLKIETHESLKKIEVIEVIVVRTEKFIQNIEARVQELLQEVKGVNRADEQEQKFLKKIEARKQEFLNEIEKIESIKQEFLKEIKEQEQGLLKKYEEKKHEFLEKIERQEQEFLQKTEGQEQEFLKKIKEEIAKYIPPSKTKTYRAIKISSIVLAIIVALTAGLATGGAIYLLIGSSSTFYTVLAIVVGLFVFKAGVQSNYNFFSSTLSDFFRMVARDELTQYIDKETDKREQMRGFKKFSLGFAFIFALSVGVVSAALLVGSIMGLSALIFPFLGPTVPLVLGGVLGLCYGIALTITMFYAFVIALKNPFSSSEIKNWFTNLTLPQVLGYFIKGALTALVFFGIGFGCKVSIVTLVTLLSAAFPFISVPVISALCIGLAVVSFIGQVPFAVLSVNKFCNTIVSFFHSIQNSQELKSCDEQEKCGNRFFSILKTYYNITINALGNAALVFIKGSISSMFAVVGSGFYSFSGNMPEPINKEKQEADVEKTKFITDYLSGSTEITQDCVNSSEMPSSSSSEIKTQVLTGQFGGKSYSIFNLPKELTIESNNNQVAVKNRY